MIRRIQLTLLMLFIGVWAMASETSVKNADGVEIWYDFDSNTKTASVTYKGKSPYSNNDRYIGNVVIPSKVTYEGKEYSVTSIGSGAFSGCSSLTSITIPKGVTSIGDFAFAGCSSLTSITIPEGVTEIGKRAFSSCSSLTSITLLEGVTKIGEEAFYYCRSLTSITIPEGVTEIGKSAFYECSSLTSITLLGSETEIGEWAFSNCNSLTSITLPEGVTSIGDYAFRNCPSLTSITLPEGVTSIGYGAFFYCNFLTSITIPESVTSIGDEAFSNCDALTSITIPESVTEIGEEAFFNCSSLTSITSLNVTPPSNYDGSMFDGVDKSIPVYVPKQSVEAYKSADGWKDFTNIQGIDDTPISDVIADSVSIRLIGNSLIVEGAESYAVYALSGQCLGKVESLERGLYIVVADGVSKKIVVK